MKTVPRTVLLVLILLQSVGVAVATIDDAKAATAGVRKLSGKRLTLYTDLSGKEVDELPAVFDQAFSQWCRYFRVKEDAQADWRMTGFLMKDKARFIAAGLLADDLPPFKHAYSRGRTLWVNEQPSDYYRRHLLLHEGTHGFMSTVLGGCGPPWYMEGMAEYLATHRWQDGRLTLGYMPQSRDEAPEWGRIRIIQDAVAEGRALRWRDVIESPEFEAKSENEPYAWCWAAATLLDRHPRYRQRFRQLSELVKQRDFNARFFRLFDVDWQELCEQWQLMVADLEYGYDVARCAVDFTPGRISPRPVGDRPGVNNSSPLPQAGEGPGVRASGDTPDSAAAVTVVADRGWQNTGLRLQSGRKYRLTAAGRYQIANGDDRVGQTFLSAPGQARMPAPLLHTEPKIWWSEPGGVSIRYYKGRPLGILLAAVRPDHPPADGVSALLNPIVVGLGATISPAETGTLYLKINDSAGQLGDNAGQLKVEVCPD